MSLKSRNMDMVNGPLLKNIFIFSLPLMATNLLQMMFNAADTIIVGKFAGQQALAAVGATGSLIFLITSLFNGLGIGTNVVIANALGAKDDQKVQESVHTSMVVGIIGGLILMCIGIFASKTFLTLMSTPSDIINQSTLYMRIIFIGAPFMILYNFGAAILRSKGDTNRPMVFLCISGVVNVVLNCFFVVVLGIDVAGVAIATIISQLVSCILVIRALLTSDDLTRLHLDRLKLVPSIAMDMLRIGIPAGIQGMAFAISNVVIQSSINSFDSSVIVAGNSAAANIENFVYIGMMAFTQATMTFTSQNVGAKNVKNVKKIMIVTMILDCASALLVGFIAWYFGEFFLSLYTDDLRVVEVGMIRLFWVALLLMLNGILDVFISSMRGMGYSTFPTIVMMLGVCGVRLVWLYTYFPVHKTLDVIYFCYPLSWVITSILLGLLWIKAYKAFKNNKTF